MKYLIVEAPGWITGNKSSIEAEYDEFKAGYAHMKRGGRRVMMIYADPRPRGYVFDPKPTDYIGPSWPINSEVRIRVHWRYKGRTGTVTGMRIGNGGIPVYDVALDAGGTAMQAGESVSSLYYSDLEAHP